MNLNQIIAFAELKQKQAYQNERLIDIYSGNLIEYVKNSLKSELSAASLKVAEKRIPSINLLEKITDKLSQVYNVIPERKTTDIKDQEILNQYIQSADLQAVLGDAEILLNLNKNFALEPYINDQGLISIRLLAAHTYCVYSDSVVDPNKPTHFVKFMGSEVNDKEIVNIYWIYSDQDFVIVDSKGVVRQKEANPYGAIPFVYVSSDSFKLQPNPDVDSFENTILVPKLLTDLNYATQFQSHSIMYGIDVAESQNSQLQNSPDAFWSLQSNSDNPSAKPQIGVISPTVDVDKVLSLLTHTVSAWLDCKGIKPGSGNVTNASPESAVSKIVDEADASQLVNYNRILLTKAEQKLWKLISVIHNSLIGSEQMQIKRGLSQNLEVSIVWPIQTLVETPQAKREELKFKLENKLISYMRALKQANPDLSEDEIMKLKQEIEAEQSNQQSQ